VSKIRDKWGRDVNTGARGLEMGLRSVRGGAVRIGGDLFVCSVGSLEKYEGKKIHVRVMDAWATEYLASDAGTMQSIATLRVT